MAVYSTELSWSMSVSICVFYWPFEFYNFVHDKRDFTYFTSFMVHSFPITVTMLNLLMSKIVFLKKDAKFGFII